MYGQAKGTKIRSENMSGARVRQPSPQVRENVFSK